MAEILLLNFPPQEVKLLTSKFNSAGLQAASNRVDKTAADLLGDHTPAFVIAKVRRGEDWWGDFHQDLLQAASAVRVRIIYYVVANADDLEDVLEALEIRPREQDVGIYYQGQLAKLVRRVRLHLKSARNIKQARARIDRQVGGMALVVAKLKVHQLINKDLRELAKTTEPNSRFILIQGVEDQIGRLERLAAMNNGQAAKGIAKMAEAAKARLATVLGTDRLQVIYAAADGDRTAIHRISQEAKIAHLRKRLASFLEYIGEKPAERLAAEYLQGWIEESCREAARNETSSADPLGIVIMGVIRELDRFRVSRGSERTHSKHRGHGEGAVTDDEIGVSIKEHALSRPWKVENGTRLYSISQVARALGLDSKTLYKWLKTGRVKGHRAKNSYPTGKGRLCIREDQIKDLFLWAGRPRSDRHGGSATAITVSEVIGLTRAEDPRLYERMRKAAERFSDRMGLGRRNPRGTRLFSLHDADQIRCELRRNITRLRANPSRSNPSLEDEIRHETEDSRYRVNDGRRRSRIED